MSRIPLRVAAGLACALVGASANADQGPMGQGEARINIRSDVKLAVKGTRGTPSDRLQQLGGIVADQMGALRKCYARLVSERSSTVGELAIRITLARGKRNAKLEIKEKGGTEPDLTKCVRRVLSRTSYREVERPAAAIVTLDFANTRAQGQDEMVARRAAAQGVDVTRLADGRYHATWGTPDGKVAFDVRGAVDGGARAVEVVLRGLRASFAGFLDCRRRCDKGDLSPEGETQATLRLRRRGRPRAKVESTTVAHRRAPPCIKRALRRLDLEPGPAGARVDVRIRFGP